MTAGKPKFRGDEHELDDKGVLHVHIKAKVGRTRISAETHVGQDDFVSVS